MDMVSHYTRSTYAYGKYGLTSNLSIVGNQIMKYLGISEGFHDAAVALVNEERVIEFASQSERLTRIKNCRMNPPEYRRLRHDKVIFHEDFYNDKDMLKQIDHYDKIIEYVQPIPKSKQRSIL